MLLLYQPIVATIMATINHFLDWNKMKINRLISIIVTLVNKKRISAEELATIFEVSTRTIYRDIESICMAGIPIRSISGVGGGFEIMEDYKINMNLFSEEDINTLLIGISSIPRIVKSKDFNYTLVKINNLKSINSLKTEKLNVEQLYIDYSHWFENKNVEPHINKIKIALQENKLISFDYINHEGYKRKRQVEPYQLVFKSSHWYLYGYCLVQNDLRLFKLTRISDLKVKKLNFTPQKSQKSFQYSFIENLLEINSTVKLRIHESIIERLLDYCDFDSFKPDGIDHYIINFPFIENDYYYNIILGFGSQCECLEPLPIRLELKRKIAELSKLYDN